MVKINILSQIKNTVSMDFNSAIGTISSYSNTLNVIGRENNINVTRETPKGVIRCGESKCGSKLHPFSETCL